MGFANQQVKVTAKLLNCRLQPSMDAKILNVIKMDEIHNIVAELNGWGQLENGTWINLKFTVPYGEVKEESTEISSIFVTGMDVVGEPEPEVESTITVSTAVDSKSIPVQITEPRLHKVKKRESLWDIAELYFGKGNGERYTEIKEFNSLKSNILRSGMVLKIPND